MKLKITITGQKVHEVGYRPYLTELAMRMALRGFEVYNDEVNGKQAVIILAEGDEQRVGRFNNSAMTERPEIAIVDDVRSEDYFGKVMPLWQFSSINTASQINKAIPILLKIQENTKDTPRILEGIKEIQENTKDIPKILDGVKEIQENTKDIPRILDGVKEIQGNTNVTPQILNEIKGLREDIHPGFSLQFRQVQEDIKAIKERLGMP